MLYTIFLKVINMSFTAGVVVVIVLLARLLLKKLPKGFSYVLWSAVLFRLLIPFAPESNFRLLPVTAEPVTMRIVEVIRREEAWKGLSAKDSGLTKAAEDKEPLAFIGFDQVVKFPFVETGEI